MFFFNILIKINFYYKYKNIYKLNILSYFNKEINYL